MLRNKTFCQSTYPTTVKPCSYIPLMTRNRYSEMTVLNWKGVIVRPSKASFFGHIPSGKLFQHCKATIYYSGLPYMAFVIFTLDILVPLQKYRENFQTLSSLAKNLNFTLSWSLHYFLLQWPSGEYTVDIADDEGILCFEAVLQFKPKLLFKIAKVKESFKKKSVPLFLLSYLKNLFQDCCKGNRKLIGLLAVLFRDLVFLSFARDLLYWETSNMVWKTW